MTLTRPRMIAASLCLLLALAVGFVVYRQPDPRFVSQSSQPLMVMSEPPPPVATAVMEPAAPPVLAAPDPRAGAGPAVSPTAAPGVAFNYRYAFRLAAPAIAGVQEQHAQLCERIGAARCRITGMLYRVRNDGGVEARLELKLDPRIARFFGRTGAEAAVHAQGIVAESEISGTDAAAAIRDAGRDLARLTAELERIEARLRAVPATRPDERTTLDFQAQQIRLQIGALRDRSGAQQEMLASTPMLFQYGSDGFVPAAAAGQPSPAEALARAVGNLLGGVNILLILVATLLPWALAVLAGWALIRLMLRRRPAPESPA